MALFSTRMLTGLLIAACSASSVHAALVNGDFETGDFTGWTLSSLGVGQTTGTGLPDVAVFDTNGVTPSAAAHYRVGTTDFSGQAAGGELAQQVTLSANGIYDLSADIAAANTAAGPNAQGGVFTLLWDSVPLATYDFGIIAGNSAERASLLFHGALDAGNHTLAIRITRTVLTSDQSPFQYLDNVTVNQVVPEPQTWLLSACGVILLAGVMQRRSTARS